MPGMNRCKWAGSDSLMIQYHDDEWGVPSYDDRHLFEMLTLEGAQAGLSWMTILKKRDNYRRLFAGFDPVKVARFTKAKREHLLEDAGIVRNRMKIESTISNAKALIKIQRQCGSFADYIWAFVDGSPIQNRWKTLAQMPSKTAESQRMSRELKKQGFNFVGPTICYAFMQAVGMVNDHEVGCFRHNQLS